jgi:hypothetical protein
MSTSNTLQPPASTKLQVGTYVIKFDDVAYKFGTILSELQSPWNPAFKEWLVKYVDGEVENYSTSKAAQLRTNFLKQEARLRLVLPPSTVILTDLGQIYVLSAKEISQNNACVNVNLHNIFSDQQGGFYCWTPDIEIVRAYWTPAIVKQEPEPQPFAQPYATGTFDDKTRVKTRIGMSVDRLCARIHDYNAAFFDGVYVLVVMPLKLGVQNAEGA